MILANSTLPVPFAVDDAVMMNRYQIEDHLQPASTFGVSNSSECNKTAWVLQVIEGALYWWPINKQTGPILLPSYPLTYINLHINMEAIR